MLYITYSIAGLYEGLNNEGLNISLDKDNEQREDMRSHMNERIIFYSVWVLIYVKIFRSLELTNLSTEYRIFRAVNRELGLELQLSEMIRINSSVTYIFEFRVR